MIGYLRGKIREAIPGRLLLVLFSGEGKDSGAIGYSVAVPQGVAYHGLIPGEWVELSVHTHVREDALELYGFLTALEKEIFLTLVSVSGIGPKGALGILSGAESGDLVRAIAEEDKDFLTKLPGIGKKTAERVVVELADPMRKRLAANPGVSGRVPRSQSGATSEKALGSVQGMLEDARSALMGLGYREAEAGTLLDRALKGLDAPPARVEEMVRLALRQLS